MRVLIACQPIAGHLNPNLGLAGALRSREHRVAFYSGEDARRVIEPKGFPLYRYHPSMDEKLIRIMLHSPDTVTAGSIGDDRWAMFRRKALNDALKEWFLETIPQQLEDLKNIYANFKPDLLVCDVTLMGPILILKDISSVPVAVFSVIPACPLPSPKTPPWGRGLPPARNSLESLKLRIEKRVTSWIVSEYRGEANRLRYHYNLPRLTGNVAEEYGRVPLFLVSGTPSLDYNRQDLPESVKYVGVCTSATTEREEIPVWMNQLDGGRPVIYVSEGTIHSKEPVILRAAVAGLSGHPYHVIITTGNHRDPEKLGLGAVGSNVRVEQYVSHEALFERTDLVVTTGSAGTILKALLAGIPLLVIPIGWEHAENAERVNHAGVGLRLKPGGCNPKKLRQAAEEILTNSRYRENARRVGLELQSQGGADRAAQLLEELVIPKR